MRLLIMGDELNINGKKPIMVTARKKKVNKYYKKDKNHRKHHDD